VKLTLLYVSNDNTKNNDDVLEWRNRPWRRCWRQDPPAEWCWSPTVRMIPRSPCYIAYTQSQDADTSSNSLIARA